MFRQVLRILINVVAPGAVGIEDDRQKFRKTGSSIAVLVWKVCTAEERLTGRQKKDRQGPSAAARHGLHCAHIDLIEIGTLFAVDFDTNEILIHRARDPFVLEGFAFHDMTPMAGGITDTQQDRFVFAFSASESLFTP